MPRHSSSETLAELVRGTRHVELAYQAALDDVRSGGNVYGVAPRWSGGTPLTLDARIPGAELYAAEAAS